MEKETQNLTKDQQQQMLFVMLIQQHQQICMMGLGKIMNPSTNKIERDLSAARYAIDTLAMMQEYTKGNTTAEVTEYLGHVLSTLRLNYVDEINSPQEQEQEQEQEGTDSEPD